VESYSWTDSVVGGICFYLAQVVVSFIGALCITTFAGDYRVFFIFYFLNNFNIIIFNIFNIFNFLVCVSAQVFLALDRISFLN
jgi:hypothetical protein